MEKTLTTTKGRIHQKWTEQAGKGDGLAMRIAAQDATKYTKEGMRKATRAGSTKTKTIADEKNQNILAHRRKTCFMDLAASTTCA
jgi:hypothetical protein